MIDEYKKSLDTIKKTHEKNLEVFMQANEAQKRNFETIKKLSNIDVLKHEREKILQMNSYLNDATKPVAIVEYEKYVQNRKNVQKQVKELKLLYNSLNPQLEYLNNFASSNEFPSPISLLTDDILSESEMREIAEELSDVEWEDLIEESVDVLSQLNGPIIDLVTKSPEEFALKLQNHINEIDDSELSSIFNPIYLNELAKSNWWILPRLDLEEYKKQSQNNLSSRIINRDFMFEYLTSPELLSEVIENWNFNDEVRSEVINQVFINYLAGNYEVCVIVLLLQLEGIMREKLAINDHRDGILREELENRLIDHLNQKQEVYSPWEIFLIKSSQEYLWMILKPLYEDKDLVDEDSDVNRNVAAHNGKVKASQYIVIKLIFAIDTLMYLFELLE